MLTSPHPSAWRHGALTLGHAIRLQQMSGKREAAERFTSGLDAYWSAAHRNPDRARRGLLCSNCLKAHGKDEPQPSTSGFPLGELLDSEESPAPPPEVGRFG